MMNVTLIRLMQAQGLKAQICNYLGLYGLDRTYPVLHRD